MAEVTPLTASPNGNVGTSNIADGAATLAKLANLANGKAIGRTTAGTGVPEAISAASNFFGQVGVATISAMAAANSSITLPAKSFLLGVAIKNNTANAVTGGVKIGTASGGAQVIVALAVGANGTVFVADTALLLRYFDSAQQLFVDAVVAMNSATLDVNFIYAKLG